MSKTNESTRQIRSKPSYFRTLPDTIAQSPSGARLQSSSPFPLLDPTKQFKSVYERAGFDVYRPSPSTAKSHSERSTPQSSKSRSASQLTPATTPHHVFPQKRNISEQAVDTSRHTDPVSKHAGKLPLRIDSSLANKTYASNSTPAVIPSTATSSQDSHKTENAYAPSSATSSHFDTRTITSSIPGSVYASAQSLPRASPSGAAFLPKFHTSSSASINKSAPSLRSHQTPQPYSHQAAISGSQRFRPPTPPQHTVSSPTRSPTVIDENLIQQGSPLEARFSDVIHQSPVKQRFNEKKDSQPAIVVEDFGNTPTKTPVDYTFEKINGTYHSPKVEPPSSDTDIIPSRAAPEISSNSVKYTPTPLAESSNIVTETSFAMDDGLNVSIKDALYASSDEESLRSGIISPKNNGFDFETNDDIILDTPKAQPSVNVSPFPTTIPQFTFNGPDDEPLHVVDSDRDFQSIKKLSDARYSTASSVYVDEFSPRQSVTPFSTTSADYENYVKQQREISEKKGEEIARELSTLISTNEDDSDLGESDYEDAEIDNHYNSAQAFEEVEGELEKLTLKSDFADNSNQDRAPLPNKLGEDYNADHGHDRFGEDFDDFEDSSKFGEDFNNIGNQFGEDFNTKSRDLNGYHEERITAQQYNTSIHDPYPFNSYKNKDTHQPQSNISPSFNATQGPTIEEAFDFDNPDFSKPLQIEMHSLKQVSTDELPSLKTPLLKQKSQIGTPTPTSIHITAPTPDFDERSFEDIKSFEPLTEDDDEIEVFKYAPGEGPCRKCDLEITKKPIYSKTGELSGQWHRNCFTCTLCDVKFNKNISCFVLDDEPYCESHYHLTNNSLCKVCGTGIVGQCLENDAQERYHIDCLKCTKCHKLVDSDYLSVNGAVFCEPCAIDFTKTHNNNRIEKRRTRMSFI